MAAMEMPIVMMVVAMTMIACFCTGRSEHTQSSDDGNKGKNAFHNEKCGFSSFDGVTGVLFTPFEISSLPWKTFSL